VTPLVGILTLVGITVVWGTTFAIVKDALTTIPVPLLLALRFSIASALFAFVRFDRRALRPAMWLGLLAFAGFASQTVGLGLTSASNAAFITGLSVVLTPIAAALVWRRAVATRVFVAAAVATVGLGFLTLGADGIAGVSQGDLWVLITAVTYALYIVYLGEVAGRASATALAGLQHLPMALLAWAWAWAVGDIPAIAEVPTSTYLAILYLAVVATALVSVLQTYAQRVVAAPVAAIVFALEPVFAALFAAWWLAERLPPIGWLGGGLVVVAMLISELKRLPRLTRR
jgi:drug/metabolite transporter (DMT)-like permease